MFSVTRVTSVKFDNFRKMPLDLSIKVLKKAKQNRIGWF